MSAQRRGYAERIGDTKFKFFWPCGHTDTKDYSKGPVHLRMGPTGAAMMASWWSKEKGGVSGICRKCEAIANPKKPLTTPKR